MAVAAALELPASFYVEMRGDYLERRDAIVAGLNECGFEAPSPAGAYYIMAGIAAFPYEDDIAMARHLIEQVAVATVPGSSFYHDPKLGQKHIRFSFPEEAVDDRARSSSAEGPAPLLTAWVLIRSPPS